MPAHRTLTGLEYPDDMEPAVDSDFVYAAIVTTYRRSGLLAETLRAIAAQTLPPACVIVADDGSGEPHHSKNQALAEQYGFTYLPLEHSGLPGMARDRALALVVEPWVALCDDDDVWDSEHIERLSHHVASSVAMVAGNARRSDTQQPCRAVMPSSLNVFAEFPRNQAITSAVLIRHESLISIGGFAPFPRGAEDYATWLRLATLGKTVIVNEPSIMYRITDDSLSAQASSAKRPLPLICAADFLVWWMGRHLTLGRVGTKLWTAMAGVLVRRASRSRNNA